MDCETVGSADDASERAGSTGRAITASAVLVCAALFMACPAVVAVISMVDPRALDTAAEWLQHLSPAISFLDYVKAAVTVVSLAVVWKSRRVITQETAVGSPDLRKVLSG